jgi:class 3 adenylate cyclase
MSVAPEMVTRAIRMLRPVRPTRGPEHRSALVVDIAGFGRWHDPQQILARDVLTTAVRTGFRTAGVRWSDLAVQDRGDGMLVLVPAYVSKVDILDPVIPRLAAMIRQHNARNTPHIRIRVSLHAGEVHRDAHGWVGSDVNTACRLADADPVREKLIAHGVLVVSDLIYQGVVRHGYRRVDPDSFTPVEVDEKEVRTRAWVAQL